MTIEAMTEQLNIRVATLAKRGWYVQSRSETQVVLEKKRTMHTLHLILTLCTISLWGIVWLWRANRKPKRKVLTISENSLTET